MKPVLSILMIFCLVICGVMANNTVIVKASEEPVSAIYGGGPVVFGGSSVMNDLKASGFNTVIIWAVHVRANGDLFLNDKKVCAGGAYVGEASWVTDWASLKQGSTSVNRIELSVGAWASDAFANIKNLIASDGTGSQTVLYKNFQALINATGADAVNYDDESTYDIPSSVSFGQMINAMGKKVTLCPYTNSSYWVGVKNQLGNIVDRVYLQCYAGGSGNNPGTWNSTMGMKVIPGMWCLNSSSGGSTASQVKNQMQSWENSYDIAGGFMWLYDDMKNLSSPNATADYANAILEGCGGSVTPPTGNYPVINGNTYYEWIDRVEVGSFNITTGNNSGYKDNTSNVINVSKGNNYQVELTPGFRSSSYNEVWRIFIDYNKDGDFTDSGETVYSGSGSSTVTGSIAIPSNVSTGETRMRIVMKYNSAPSSAGSIGDGEAEDYTVNIQ